MSLREMKLELALSVRAANKLTYEPTNQLYDKV